MEQTTRGATDNEGGCGRGAEAGLGEGAFSVPSAPTRGLRSLGWVQAWLTGGGGQPHLRLHPGGPWAAVRGRSSDSQFKNPGVPGFWENGWPGALSSWWELGSTEVPPVTWGLRPRGPGVETLPRPGLSWKTGVGGRAESSRGGAGRGGVWHACPRSLVSEVPVYVHVGLLDVADEGRGGLAVGVQQDGHGLLPVGEVDAGAVLQAGAVLVLVQVVLLPEA